MNEIVIPVKSSELVAVNNLVKKLSRKYNGEGYFAEFDASLDCISLKVDKTALAEIIASKELLGTDFCRNARMQLVERMQPYDPFDL